MRSILIVAEVGQRHFGITASGDVRELTMEQLQSLNMAPLIEERKEDQNAPDYRREAAPQPGR